MLRATHMNSWYPSGQQLDNMLKEAYDEAKVVSGSGKVKSVIVPHAGYRFCVKTSMNAFKNVDPSTINRVFVLGPSHQIPISNCTIADAATAETPYGEIPFDTEACNALTSKFPKLFKKLDRDTASIEHSMEMEFPLLKYIFKEKPFTLVPIMVGQLSPNQIIETAEALKPFINDANTLLVISSDFCHWGARFGYTYLPDMDGQIFEKIRKLDHDGAEMIASGEPEKFENYLKKTKNTICGRTAILIMMNIFQGKHAEFLHYSQSSEVVSKHDTSVSYFSAILRG
ncbi:Protein MEMO1 like protein [Tritrichomonas foetus]|uniref:Protein MEMO1 like protein n=1 Tax=Tritrichomonas foetus TaxID=1144522 RepID=A0A1J4JMB0_9EUKA|nr:Protein MEMO1 like protein [Tritrichomonas foetus]|eukprot:OHS98707.1 Protein MEMO1 like protein [Tritrichomonas foetus]